jgi:hypothetical protein
VSDSNLNLFDTTLANNTATARPGPDGSGSHAQGGAVSFDGPGQLTLRNVSMTGNAVDAPRGAPLGGGIASRGITSLQNSIAIGIACRRTARRLTRGPSSSRSATTSTRRAAVAAGL